jgi:copper chaperone
MLLLTVSACKPKTTTNQSIANNEPVVVELSITGMSCMGCVETVRSSITQMQGIDTVTVSLEKANALVTFRPSVTDTASIRKAVELNGYKVVKSVQTGH